MVGVAERGPGHFHIWVGLEVGTSREGEAMILLCCVRQLSNVNWSLLASQTLNCPWVPFGHTWRVATVEMAHTT